MDRRQKKQKNNSALKNVSSCLCGLCLAVLLHSQGTNEKKQEVEACADCCRKRTVGQRAATFASQGLPVFGDSCVASERLPAPEISQTSAFVFRAKRSFGSYHLHNDSLGSV
jgi:hypothetical protein